MIFWASLQAKRIRTLFLDLGSNQGSIACVDGGLARLTPVDHRVDDAALTRLLEDSVAGAGWTWKDLGRVACVTGPGGFTSLRVGVAAVNALVYALGIPAAGIRLDSLYEARAKGFPTSPAGFAGFHWLHSTKKTLVFHKSVPSSAEPQCLELGALPGALASGGSWAGELLPEHRTIAEAAGLTELPLAPMESVLPAVLDALEYSGATLEPWYGRGW